MPRTACSGMPSSRDPRASGSPAEPPPARPPIRSTPRSARKKVTAPRASPAATNSGPPIRSPSSASSKATLEIRAPAPNPNTAPTGAGSQCRISARRAPMTNEEAASAPQPRAVSTSTPATPGHVVPHAPGRPARRCHGSRPRRKELAGPAERPLARVGHRGRVPGQAEHERDLLVAELRVPDGCGTPLGGGAETGVEGEADGTAVLGADPVVELGGTLLSSHRRGELDQAHGDTGVPDLGHHPQPGDVRRVGLTVRGSQRGDTDQAFGAFSNERPTVPHLRPPTRLVVLLLLLEGGEEGVRGILEGGKPNLAVPSPVIVVQHPHAHLRHGEFSHR